MFWLVPTPLLLSFLQNDLYQKLSQNRCFTREFIQFRTCALNTIYRSVPSSNPWVNLIHISSDTRFQIWFLAFSPRAFQIWFWSFSPTYFTFCSWVHIGSRLILVITVSNLLHCKQKLILVTLMFLNQKAMCYQCGLFLKLNPF